MCFEPRVAWPEKAVARPAQVLGKRQDAKGAKCPDWGGRYASTKMSKKQKIAHRRFSAPQYHVAQGLKMWLSARRGAQ